MKTKKALALSQAGILILGIVAFAFFIGLEAKVVRGDEEEELNVRNIINIFVKESPTQENTKGLDGYYHEGKFYIRQKTGLFQAVSEEEWNGRFPDSPAERVKSLATSGNAGKALYIEREKENSLSFNIAEGIRQKRDTCLTPSTLIILPDLSAKPISSIQIGEEVLSYDFEKGELTKEKVMNVIVSKKSSYLRINGKLEITPNHEVLLNGEWKEVGKAKVGDYFLGVNGEKIFIETIEKIDLDREIEVYDLDLGGKWYFAEGVLVHNSDRPSAAQVLTNTPGGTDVKVDGEGSQHSGNGGGDSQQQKEKINENKYANVAHLFGTTSSWYGAAYLLQGLQWAGIAYGAIGMIGSLFMKDNPEQLEAIQKAAFVGIMSASLVRGVIAKGGLLQNLATEKTAKTVNWLTANQGWISFTVGAIAAWLMYNKEHEKKEVFTERVEFRCLPWQAPLGGVDCELCNHEQLPCSEYRCRSLGQTCEIINKGKANEMCVDSSTRNVNPPVIKPWKEKLTPGYTYTDVKTSPPGAGFKIKRNDLNTCIEAFKTIEFGVQTDKPSQCKIDLEKKEKFEDMLTFMGGDNLYKYNHSELLVVPRAKDFKNASITLEMGNEMTLYIMCRDHLGNINTAPYAVRFCVDSTPDQTPPQIKAVSVESGSCVTADQNETPVEFYIDEPAQCKWDFNDADYSQMKYNMSCSTEVYEINSMLLYTCRATLTGVKRDGTTYYIRCEDNPNSPEKERNVMRSAFVYTAKGSNPLKIKSVQPNGTTIYGGVSPMPVTLRVETLFGCNNNKAVCFYSKTGEQNSYIMFYDTNKDDGVSTQRLDLYGGKHKYFIKCVDAGGNVAETTTEFELDIDTTSPVITRAYYQDEYLKVVTFRKSDCVYSTESCDFLFNEGTIMPYQNSPIHVVSFDPEKTYYIKCRDEFRNEPIDCSLIVRPKKNFLV